MIRRVFGCFLLFIMTLILLSGCSFYHPTNTLESGLCYWENKIRHNLPDRLPQSSSFAAAHFKQKQIISPLNFGEKLFKQSSSPIDFNGDIYIAGWFLLSSTDSHTDYWKNGEIVYLESSSGRTYDIYVEGNDVYVAGVSVNGACYWKNGERFDLPDGKAATAIFVKDGVVYALGYHWTYDYTTAMGGIDYYIYWVNGVEHRFVGTSADDIYVDGNDVYVAGSIAAEVIGGIQACYWKNDVCYPLNNCFATSIIVQNSNVYVAGFGGGDRETSELFVSGSDVYTAGSYSYLIDSGPYTGYHTSGACYWKNDELIPLNKGGGKANYICVSGDDVFVSGEDIIPETLETHTFWVNGQSVDIGPGFYICDPKGIFVVPHSN